LIGGFLATRKYEQQGERHVRCKIFETDQKAPPEESLGGLTTIVPEKWQEAVWRGRNCEEILWSGVGKEVAGEESGQFVVSMKVFKTMLAQSAELRPQFLLDSQGQV
jgi:hypothetical protein